MEATGSRPQLFSNRDLLNLTIPIMLNSLMAIAAGMVDSAMVSSAGEAAVSAVSLVDSFNILFISMFVAISTGGSVVVSQYVGSKNFKRACISANQLLYISVSIATVLMCIMLPLVKPILRLVYGSLDESVMQNAIIYFTITLMGYPLSAIGNSCTAVLQAMGKSRQAATINITYNIINVIGNAVLIYGFHMGVAGAAISTNFCRVVFAVMGLYLAHSKKLPVRFVDLLKFHLDFDAIRRVMRIGVSNGVENSLFNVGKLMVAGLVSSFGTVYIAANSVANTINNIGWNIVASFGTVLLTVVGQCIGAGEPNQAKYYTKKLLTVATVVMLVLFSGVFLLRHHLVRIFDFNDETLEVAAYYTGIAAVMSMITMYPFAFVAVHAFRAAGDIRYAVTLSIFSMFAFRVGMCYLLNALFPSLGLIVLYIGMTMDWGFRSTCNIIRFRSEKWLHKKLI